MRHLRNGAILLAAWCLLAAWQWHEYGHERNLIRRSLVTQAESVANALVSGIRSHRWLGPFIREQLPATLEELCRSESVISVSITSQSGDGSPLEAGLVDLLEGALPVGGTRRPTGYHLVREFTLDPNARGGRFAGQGGGPRSGYARGAGDRAERADDSLSGVMEFKATLLFDSKAVEAQCRQSALNRGLIVVSGGLLTICLVWVWRTQVRLVETRGRAQVLESEARHLRDLSQTAAGLAHETRNPLALIRGWAQRLTDPDVTLREDQADAILEECDRITARINQFMAFARPSEPNVEPINLFRLIEELRTLLQPDLDAKRLVIETGQIPEACVVRADADLLRQALFNLLQNAIQFAPEATTVGITLSVHRSGTRRLAVVDQGPGVGNEHVEMLFTPYFTTRHDGTGLGLAIVQRIAVAHQWRTGYSPRNGGGAEFWIDGIHG